MKLVYTIIALFISLPIFSQSGDDAEAFIKLHDLYEKISDRKSTHEGVTDSLRIWNEHTCLNNLKKSSASSITGQPDSIKKYDYNSLSDSSIKTCSKYIYDDKHRTIKENHYYLAGSMSNVIITYDYDGRGNVTYNNIKSRSYSRNGQMLGKTWNNDYWYEYDDKDRLTFEKHYSMNDTATYFYQYKDDSYGRLIEEVKLILVGTDTIVEYNNLYLYKANQLYLKIKKASGRLDSIYFDDAGNDTLQLQYAQNFNDYKLVFQSGAKFDEKNRLVKRYEKNISGNTEFYTKKENIRYDERDRRVYYKSENWRSSGNDTIYRLALISSIDTLQNGRRTLQLRMDSSSDGIKNVEYRKQLSKYDDKGRRRESTYFEYNEEQEYWDIKFKDSLLYNTAGRMTDWYIDNIHEERTAYDVHLSHKYDNYGNEVLFVRNIINPVTNALEPMEKHYYYYGDDHVLKSRLPEKLFFSIYPNPVHDELHYFLDQAEFKGSFSLYSLTGSLVSKGSITHPKSSFDVSSLHPGVYVVIFTEEYTDKMSAPNKIIISR